MNIPDDNNTDQLTEFESGIKLLSFSCFTVYHCAVQETEPGGQVRGLSDCQALIVTTFLGGAGSPDIRCSPLSSESSFFVPCQNSESKICIHLFIHSGPQMIVV